MELEILARMCWRRRFRLLAAVIVGAASLAAGGRLLLPHRYESSADVSVAGAYPTTGSDAPASQVYVMQPDRFVATQIETLGSRGAAAAVASDLGLRTQAVAHAVKVTQLGKSDVIRVTATTASPEQSVRIADRTVANYLRRLSQETRNRYTSALQAMDGEMNALARQIAAARARNPTGASAGTDGSLSSLTSQYEQLVTKQQGMLVESTVVPGLAHVVSSATVNLVPVGPGTGALAAYGAALGLALGLSTVMLGSRSGRALVDLEATDEVADVPVLGVLGGNSRRRRGRRRELGDLRTVAIAGEMTRLIQLKGPLQLIVVGGSRSVDHLQRRLVPVINARLAGLASSGLPVWRPLSSAAEPVVRVQPLLDFLHSGNVHAFAVVGIDADAVSPGELDAILGGLRTSGTDVLGIVGTR